MAAVRLLISLSAAAYARKGFKMEAIGYAEVGRFKTASNDRGGLREVVNMRIQNDTDFKVRVVIMAHRHHDLDEHRVVVNAHQSTSTHCPKGEVVVVVFNVDSNSFYGGYVLDVTGDFSFPIS